LSSAQDRSAATRSRVDRRRRSVESDFKISITENFVEVRFAPTRSLYVFACFTTEREIAEFGPVSPDPVEQRRRRYMASDVRAIAFPLALAAARPRTAGADGALAQPLMPPISRSSDRRA
jgi:hypothetical protein